MNMFQLSTLLERLYMSPIVLHKSYSIHHLIININLQFMQSFFQLFVCLSLHLMSSSPRWQNSWYQMACQVAWRQETHLAYHMPGTKGYWKVLSMILCPFHQSWRGSWFQKEPSVSLLPFFFPPFNFWNLQACLGISLSDFLIFLLKSFL